MSDEEGFLADEGDKKDEELMHNLIKGLETLKQERPPTPSESPPPDVPLTDEDDDDEEEEEEEEEEDDYGDEDDHDQPAEGPKELPSGKPTPKEPLAKEKAQPQTKKSIDFDSMPIDELRALLDQVNDARELNCQLQGMLLMKELKLLSLKKQIATAKNHPQEYKKEEQRTDVGRYYVRFKAPYFKNAYNFAGYVIVPENQLPVTSQRYEMPAGQWNKIALKELEANVRTFLTKRTLAEMKRMKPKTRHEKERIINRCTYLQRFAPMSSLIGPEFESIIDWSSVSSKMKKEFSPNECQKAWNIFLRPEINKKRWTVAEKENLKRVALDHNYQDWDAIAEELGTGRNGYQCYHFYVDKIMKLVEGDWSKGEEDFLTKLVKECTYGNKVMWHKVAYFFETRTMTQIYRKWTLSCVGKEVVAGAFTEEEDKTIMEMLIVRKGEFSIAQVAKKLNRITSQIRYRFAQLKSSLKHKYGEWSLEEDKLLLDLVEKFGRKSWSKIADHMPHRGRVQIRHRYTNLRKRLAKHPELSLETLSRYKRPVHSKRKETNLKCLMELTGMEEPPADVDTKEPLKSTVQAVEQFLGPDRKRKRKDPSETTEDLSPGRYPELEEHEPTQFNDDDGGVPDIPSPAEPDCDPLALPNPSPDKKPVKDPAKPAARRSRLPKSDPPPLSSDEEDPEPTPRSGDLHEPIVEYYSMTSDFTGNLVKPPQSSRKRSKEETLNSVLKFTPYKYFDPNNSEWTYDADRSDPYYSGVFKVIENESDSDEEDAEEDVRISDDRLLPPCLTNFEGFYNLLVDMGITEKDLQTPDDKLETEIGKLYCKDEETVAAVNRWKKRLATLFAWPAALSGVTLETEDPPNDRPEAAEDVVSGTSNNVGRRNSKGRTKSKTKLVVKTEPVDDERTCTQLSNLDLVDS